jgi:hypothetical protein
MQSACPSTVTERTHHARPARVLLQVFTVRGECQVDSFWRQLNRVFADRLVAAQLADQLILSRAVRCVCARSSSSCDSVRGPLLCVLYCPHRVCVARRYNFSCESRRKGKSGLENLASPWRLEDCQLELEKVRNEASRALACSCDLVRAQFEPDGRINALPSDVGTFSPRPPALLTPIKLCPCGNAGSAICAGQEGVP